MLWGDEGERFWVSRWEIKGPHICQGGGREGGGGRGIGIGKGKGSWDGDGDCGFVGERGGGEGRGGGGGGELRSGEEGGVRGTDSMRGKKGLKGGWIR